MIAAASRALRGIRCIDAAMSEPATKILLEAGAEQSLLGERELSFVASCDYVCLVNVAGDGWPSLCFQQRVDVRPEVLNSRTLRLRLGQLAQVADGEAPMKVALVLLRHADRQRLVLHG